MKKRIKLGLLQRWTSRFRDIGIDLGTASVLVFVRGQGIVLHEPSVVAVDRCSGNLLAVGTQAQEMLGRTPRNIVAIRPLSEGVIADYEMTERMLGNFLQKIIGRRLRKPNVVICVPSAISEVEERAVIDAGLRAGARRVFLVEEPLAAAMGAGVDITRPHGTLVVDIGGGTTDIAAISLGNVVASSSIRVGGDKFDDAIVKYVRRKYNVLIGERTAEIIKRQIGCVYPRQDEMTLEMRGRCLLSGLPRTFTVTSTDVLEALEEASTAILEALHALLESTPPELTGDILSGGVLLTGGGSLVWGMDLLIAARTGLPTHVAEEPICCVAHGTGMCLDQLGNMNSGIFKLSGKLL